jgi:hypothetical protein
MAVEDLAMEAELIVFSDQFVRTLQFYNVVGVDYDLLRVYYQGQRDQYLYCVQCAPDREDAFYVCNKDSGEPAYRVAMPEQWRLLKDLPKAHTLDGRCPRA